MLKRQHSILLAERITTTVLVIVMLLFFLSCRDKNENLVSFEYDPETVPTMITDTVTTLISDSGITRYKLVADVCKVFDKAKEPYWFFPEGIYLERFTPDLSIEATVTADTAWYYNDKELWKLKKNVHVENMKGELFDSEELYWDQKEERVYSDKYIEIKRGVTEIKGYGFESNQAMTDYRIFRPHDGKLPFSDEVGSDTLRINSQQIVSEP
ncbi:MAG: LPS export ABC transporter periplasmic protein LptC [Proteiniphilum sp.]|nr:LPS export ABC transporter periplasmic protein LptC [Proteiniphilum sp.]